MRKKRFWGRKYARIMTGSYLPFTLFILCFAILIMVISQRVNTNIMKTYLCSITDSTLIQIDGNIPIIEKSLYLYTDKNKNLYKFSIDSVLHQDGATVVNVEERQVLKELVAEFGLKPVYVEIPYGKITLIERIFP